MRTEEPQPNGIVMSTTTTDVGSLSQAHYTVARCARCSVVIGTQADTPAGAICEGCA